MNKLFSYTGLCWIWLVMFVVFVDLGSKYLLLQNFYLFEIKNLFPFLNLCYVRNYGIAFSLLSDSGAWKYWFFSGVTISNCVLLIFLMYRSKATKKLINAAYALILGGALSNLFDRWWHGFVVDMIDFFIGSWHFPVFNLADTAICSGTLLIIVKRYLSNSCYEW